MIVTRTPVRIPLGGGGTDLPAYYSKHGGFLVSAAVDKHIYIMVNKRFEDTIRVSYSKTETVSSIDEIEHPIVREVLRMVGIEKGIEIVSIADVPSNTGLGTSSSFTVGLLNALHIYKREDVTREVLAEEACHIEIDVLGEPIGKQDQYLAALGGVTCLDIDKRGKVSATPLSLSKDALDELESNTLLFYTGVRRKASDVLTEQGESLAQEKSDASKAMHTIKEIGLAIREALERSDLDTFGELMDAHWKAKKRLSSKIAFGQVDRWYEVAQKNGALGGKLIGAGGGGFMMFYCNGGKQELREAMSAEGLREMRFKVDFEGSKAVVNF
jgi:D-glycero-alpha-D-manno-heptose-7-phosphate kinase